MQMWVFRITLGIHIALAIAWVGGILFVGWGVYVAFRRFPPQCQREVYEVLMKHTHWAFALEGFGVIATGTLLGTWLGPLHSWSDVLTTRFGHIWFTALLCGAVTLFWGTFVSYPHGDACLF